MSRKFFDLGSGKTVAPWWAAPWSAPDLPGSAPHVVAVTVGGAPLVACDQAPKFPPVYALPGDTRVCPWCGAQIVVASPAEEPPKC